MASSSPRPTGRRRSDGRGTQPVTLRQLNRTTLARQGLLARLTGSPADAISHLAGLQAQHANSPYIALWSRLAGLEIADLVGAIDDRSVVKATLMRATLHLVAATDYPVFEAATRGRRSAVWAPTIQRDIDALHGQMLEFAETPRTLAELEAFVDEATMTVAGSSLADHAPGGVTRVTFGMVGARGGLDPRAAERALALARQGPLRRRPVARHARRGGGDGRVGRALPARVRTRFRRGLRPVVRPATCHVEGGHRSARRSTGHHARRGRPGARGPRGAAGRERRRAGTGPLPRALGQPARGLRRSPPHHRRRAPARRSTRRTPTSSRRSSSTASSRGRGPRRRPRASRRSTSRQW